MTVDRLSIRRQKLIQSLLKAGVSSLLVTNPKNVTYLTGFTGEDSYLLIGSKRLCLLSDSRFELQLQRQCPMISSEIRDSRTTMVDFVGQEISKHKLTSLGIEASSMTVSVRDHLSEKLVSCTLVPQQGLV